MSSRLTTMADSLEDLLRDCTVQVSGRSKGAGFFVAPGMVVTCAHVTGTGTDLRVRWERDDGSQQIAREASLITQLTNRGRPIPALDENYPDLAVLKVDGFGGHPCVQIDTERPSPQDWCQIFGYPREGGDTRLTAALLRYRGTTGRSRTVYLDLAWDTIRPGMSGAAVLNLHTGGVCGVVVASRNPEKPDGALAVPWSAVAEDLSDVLTANQAFQQMDLRWQETRRDSQAAWRSESLAARRDRLSSLLTAVRAAADWHPYTIKISDARNVPAREPPALSTVYLRQQLGAQADQAQSSEAGGSVPAKEPVGGTEPGSGTGREPAGGQGQEPPARRRGAYANPSTGVTADQLRDGLQRLDIDYVLAHNRGALIVGGPGSGKSSLLRHIIEVAAERWPSEGRAAFVPVLIHARWLLRSPAMNKAIADALRGDPRFFLPEDIDLDGLFKSPPMPGLAWLILLDGLDEIYDTEQRKQVIEIVVRLWEDPRYQWYRFVIASRPLPDSDLYKLRTIGIPTFEIQRFSDDQLPILAASWFHALGWPDAEEQAGLFIAQIRQARIAQLARNPLIATMSCVVFAAHQDRGLPTGRADLYEQFIESSLENYNKTYSAGQFPKSIKERLGPGYDSQATVAAETLARELRPRMQGLAMSRLTGSELDLRIEAEQLAMACWPSGEPPPPWNDVVAELLVHSGLISMRAGDLAFTHETIAEYLAACARTAPPRSGRPGPRERWQLTTRAGSNESYPLFVVALLRARDIADLTRRPPALLQMGKLLHARLVAALVHDGCELDANVVAVATERLAAIATNKKTGIPFILRRGIWWRDDDCVMAAKALTLLDKDRGLDLLFTLAADPTVPSFSIFDVLAEVMVTEDLTEIDSARGLKVLYRYASDPSPAGVEREEDSYNRMLIADLIMDRDAELGAELLRTLARDASMDLKDRRNCIERLVDIDKQTAIAALADVIIDAGSGLPVVLDTYSYLRGVDEPAAVAALAHVATDPDRGGFSRAVASVVLYHAARPEGLRALRELSCDRGVPGFYRVYYFPGFGDDEERDSRLLALSRNATLPAAWRAFAAEELSAYDRKTGIEALRAIRQDVSVGRRARTELGKRADLLERIPAPPGLLARPWKPVARLLHAENLATDADSSPRSVRRYLLPQERLKGTRRPHPAPLLRPLGLVLCGLIAAIVLSGLFPQARALMAIWAGWGLVLLYLVWRVAAWSIEYLFLTDQRLLRVRGLLVRKVDMIPLSAIADMQFERPLSGLALDYCTFSVAPANQKLGWRLKYMPHPDLLYRDIFSLYLTGDV
jgi:Trypsin-like peptidase domain